MASDRPLSFVTAHPPRCADAACPFDAHLTLLGEGAPVGACVDDLPDVLRAWLPTQAGSRGMCTACGDGRSPVVSVVTAAGYEVTLCHGHCWAFALGTLAPPAVARLLVVAAVPRDHVPWLCTGVYDRRLVARAPQAHGVLGIARRIESLMALGVRPTPATLAPFRAEVQARYLALTGLPLDDAVAARVLHGCAAACGARRRAARESLIAPREVETLSAAVTALYQAADPQGLVGLGLEAMPYAREAKWLVRQLAQGPWQTSATVATQVAVSLGWTPDLAIPVPVAAGVWAIAEAVFGTCLAPRIRQRDGWSDSDGAEWDGRPHAQD
jgi:hypothetical protein